MPKTTSPKPKLAFVNLFTKNYNQQTKFYEETLGLTPQKGNKGNWFGFQTGQSTFAIEPQTNRDSYQFNYNKENPYLLQFKVSTIKELKEITKTLGSKDVRITQPLKKMSFGTITTFLDLDNNVVELIVERRKKPKHKPT